jgi:hypothetical protein
VFARLEQLRQLVEPLIRHLDNRQVRLCPGVPADLRMLMRQRVEQRRFACLRQASDANLHASGLLDWQ